jgi:hypothetical protein
VKPFRDWDHALVALFLLAVLAGLLVWGQVK